MSNAWRIPPVGYCGVCLALDPYDERPRPAVTLINGTGLCRQHLEHAKDFAERYARPIPSGECRTCEGEGVVPSPDPDPSVVTSRMPDQRCPDCGGTGEEY